MTQPEADTGLVLMTRVAASRETVFDYLIEPDKMLRWMGTEAQLDPRPGGRFWLNATGTDIASGTYLEVDRPSRVVFTWGWEGSADVPPASTTVTITLTVQGGETVIELRHDGLPGGPDDEHRKGWSHLLPRLVAVVLGQDPGPNEHVKD